MLVPFTRRCVFCAIFACHAERSGRNGALEDLRDLGKGILCLIHNKYM